MKEQMKLDWVSQAELDSVCSTMIDELMVERKKAVKKGQWQIVARIDALLGKFRNDLRGFGLLPADPFDVRA